MHNNSLSQIKTTTGRRVFQEIWTTLSGYRMAIVQLQFNLNDGRSVLRCHPVPFRGLEKSYNWTVTG